MGFEQNELASLVLYASSGCERCTDGYKGRIVILQVMPISEKISNIILNGGNAQQISVQAKAEDIKNIRESRLGKIRQGITTIAEIDRITKE